MPVSVGFFSNGGLSIFVLIQAIKHATDHRSQVATVLSQQDVTLPELDGWAYYWACEDAKRKSEG